MINSPYLIDPEIPTRISFSGGRTSAYMLYKIYDANGGIPSNCHVCFANTGKERIETLDFIHAIECDLNIKIYWLEWVANKKRWMEVDYATASVKGEPFQSMNRYKGAIPNPIGRKCTSELKITVMDRWFRDLIGRKVSFVSLVGIRYDEPRRWKIEGQNSINKWSTLELPLRYAKVTESMVMDFWAGMDFDLKLSQGEGNCDLCFLKSTNKVMSMLQEKPELADWWIKQEEFQSKRNDLKQSSKLFRVDRPSYSDLKRIATTQQSFNFFDDPTMPCSCHD